MYYKSPIRALQYFSEYLDMELNPKQLNYLPGYATTQQPLPSNPIMMVNPQGKLGSVLSESSLRIVGLFCL